MLTWLDAYLIARSMLPWEQGKPDSLTPKGDTAFEVIDHWMACRASIFEHGSVRQTRYCLTDDDVRKLAEHVEKWMESR